MCFFIVILPLLYFHEHVKFHNKYMGNITDGLTGCPAQGKNKLGETIFSSYLIFYIFSPPKKLSYHILQICS